MHMKQIILAGMGLLLIWGGVLFWLLQSDNDSLETANLDQETSLVTIAGTVTDIDTSQIMVDGPGLVTIEGNDGNRHVIAVPSMGRNLCAASGNLTDPSEIAIGDSVEVQGEINAEDQIVPCAEANHYLRVSSKYMNEQLGFEFEFKKGAGGYVLEDNLANFSEHPNFIDGVMLTPTEERYAMQNSIEPREGPATIQVRVIENIDRLSPAVWVEENRQEANLELALAEPSEAVVAGANAVTYSTDGLYRMQMYVVAHAGYIYLLTGMYPSESAPIYSDFTGLIESFSFIQTADQS